MNTTRPADPAVIAAAAGKTVATGSSNENERYHQRSQRHNRGPPLDDDDEADRLAGDLLLGATRIARHISVLVGKPVDEGDVYYYRRAGKWPSGKHGAELIASKRRLNRHAQKLTAA